MGGYRCAFGESIGMSDTCIINYATGGPDSVFARGQGRLVKECLKQGYKGDFLLFNDENPLNCPSHAQVPYAFKPHAMKAAAELGYRYLLWCDSSVYPVAPLNTIFDIIKKDKYLFFMCGWKAGQWCSDAALDSLGVTRDEAMEMDQLIGGCQGLDMGDVLCRAYLSQWYELSRDGISFVGAWTNEKRQVSKDPRVLGHRHDQVCASILAWQLGMRNYRTGTLLYDNTGQAEPTPETLFMVRGA